VLDCDCRCASTRIREDRHDDHGERHGLDDELGVVEIAPVGRAEVIEQRSGAR
jgi:hypothetical protein